VAATLAALFVYPLKSGLGIALARSEVDRLGLRLDRAFMVVDAATGLFVTQREEPRLARVVPALRGDALELRAAGAGAIRVALRERDGPRRPVRVWRYAGDGIDQGDEAAAWLSELLGRPLRLVRVPRDHARRVNPEQIAFDARTSFTDGYPFLLISQAALDGINARLAEPLPIGRFRPNLLVSGTAPHAEDGWRRIRIGSLELVLVKGCERCAITTVDPATGERRGPEPLRTLAGYRRREGAVFFGQNAVHLGPGTLEVGMPVEVLETRPPPSFE
jgi:uncharacterized protein YcbX